MRNDTFTSFIISVDRPEIEGKSAVQADDFTVVCWRDLAEKVTQFSTGSLVLIEGSIITRNYDNNEGKRIYITEIDARACTLLTADSAPVKENAAFVPVLEQVENQPEQAAETNFDFNEAIKPADPQVELGEDVPF